jgi:hypothetical protein
MPSATRGKTRCSTFSRLSRNDSREDTRSTPLKARHSRWRSLMHFSRKSGRALLAAFSRIFDRALVPHAREPLPFPAVAAGTSLGLVIATVMRMPLGRYFALAGSVLLALLFLADWYLPRLGAAPARADVDRTVIRLHSGHRWPERIVIDTNLPTIVPPPAMVADNRSERSPPLVRPPKEAFAQLTPPQAVAPAVASKPALKRRTRVVRAAGRVTSSEATDFRNAFPVSW